MCNVADHKKWECDGCRSDEACIEALSSTSPLLPSLFYPERGADEALATTIGTKFYTSESTKVSPSLSPCPWPHLWLPPQGPHRLPLVLAPYSLHGAFLGLHNLTDEILVCRDLPPRYEAAWRVGVRYEVECSVGVASLSEDSQEPIFYDLCIHQAAPAGSPLAMGPTVAIETHCFHCCDMSCKLP